MFSTKKQTNKEKKTVLVVLNHTHNTNKHLKYYSSLHTDLKTWSMSHDKGNNRMLLEKQTSWLHKTSYETRQQNQHQQCK